MASKISSQQRLRLQLTAWSSSSDARSVKQLVSLLGNFIGKGGDRSPPFCVLGADDVIEFTGSIEMARLKWLD